MPSTSGRISLGLTVATAALTGIAACGVDDAIADRQVAVAEAGAEVMPFALEETTHIFTNTPSGGRQDVVVDNPGDIANIEQIRIHLAEEASKFRNGDFSDPEAIHGPDMPGLSTLQARYGDIEVGLSNTDAGASIIYTADDPDVVAAIHDWFAAQTNDHGDHAEHNR